MESMKVHFLQVYACVSLCVCTVHVMRHILPNQLDVCLGDPLWIRTIQFNSVSDYQHDKLWKHWHDKLGQKGKKIGTNGIFSGMIWARPRQDNVWF